MRVTYRDYSYIHRNGQRLCILCWKMKLWKPTFSGRDQYFCNNVNFQDDSLSAVTKVMVYAVPIDMSNERLKDIFSKYGDVIQVDHEKHKVNGRMTCWNTGNEIVSMSSVKVHIQPHMTGPHRGQNVSINTWYRVQDRFDAPNAATKIEICIKCRLTSHVTDNCPEKRKVYFIRTLDIYCGKRGDPLKWFLSYLKGRVQSVQIGSTFSREQNLLFGVPQGSVLGPVLFTIYTTPLGRIIQRHGLTYHLYADDTHSRWQNWTSDHYNPWRAQQNIRYINQGRWSVDLSKWWSTKKLRCDIRFYMLSWCTHC